jgi:micrococcal nuclease
MATAQNTQSPVLPSGKCTATAYNAQDYVGQEITVCGYVAQVSTIESINGQPTYINMGGKYPNHSFTVVIWKKNILSWDGASLQDYQNQLIAVTGEVVLYRGKPQIVAYTPSQIEVIKL